MSRRLFVSADLPDGLADRIADVQRAFADADGVSFTDPTQAHVTLKFLGDVADDRIDAVASAVETAVADAAVGPFTVVVGGLGVFPSTECVRVVWVGVRDGATELTRLREAVERETTALGFAADDHAFTPHVTLARMREARGKDLVTRLVDERDPTVGFLDARELRVTESHLGNDGPRYETVTSVGL